MNKRFFNILLFIFKTLIAIGVLWFLYKKFSEFTKSYALSFNFWEWIPTQNKHLFVFVFLLMILNWSLEALKWNILMRNVAADSLLKSFTDVLRGISISIFTPNRNGEFIGRIYHVKSDGRLKALELYFVGSLAQQFYTVCFGLIALLFSPFYAFIKYIAVILLIVTVLLLLNVNRLLQFSLRIEFIKDKLSVLKSISRSVLINTLFCSGLRYAVFFTQYALLFKLFNVEVHLTVFLITIPSIFFIGSYVPSFALTEMGVKSLIAVYCFSSYDVNEQSVIIASFLLWIINVAIPAFAGAFVWLFINRNNKLI